MRGYKIFSGSSSVDFAKEVCQSLDVPLSKAEVKRFSDGEISVQISESVRGRDVFIVQSTGAPSNDNLMELLIMTDATEAKYPMGLAACYHLKKDYKNAISTYMTCSILEAGNPIYYYHASDCYIQSHDIPSAILALEMAITNASDNEEYQTLKDRAEMMVKSLKKDIGTTKKGT